MNAIDFLPKQITPIQLKIKSKEIKEKQKVVKVATLSKEKLNYIQERVTISSHCIEFLNDLIDEMRNEKVIGNNHLLLDMQKEILNLQEYFIGKAIDKGEELERLKQQKRFEEVFTKVSKMKAKKLNKLIQIIETI